MEQEQFQETEAILIKYANKLLKTRILSGSLDKQKKHNILINLEISFIQS